MADVLAFVEQRDGQIGGSARETVGAAATVAARTGGSVHALVLGAPGIDDPAGGLGAAGAERVTAAAHEALGSYNPEGYLDVIVHHVESGDYSAVVFSATTLGKDLAPRVAAKLGVPLASDVTDVTGDGADLSFVRPVYSGKAFARVSIDATPAVLTVRPNVFPVTEAVGAGTVSSVTPEVDPSGWRVRVLERRAASDGDVDVAKASVIVSGGRGLKGPENWGVLEELRDALGPGTALGASRAVVDAGWRPHGEQVGQTGKTVAPKLYFAIGISGAVQHLAGMRTSQTIVAVNRDADAPIFSVADYGIVGDLFEVVPALSAEISAMRAAD